MRAISAKVEQESWESARLAGRCHRAMQVALDPPVTIAAGTGDEVHLFREGGLLLVLTINRRLGYAGLEVFERRRGEDEFSYLGDVFCDNDGRLIEALGPKMLILQPVNIARRLLPYATC